MTLPDDKPVPLASGTPAVVDGPSASDSGGTSAPVVDGSPGRIDAAARTSPAATRPTGRRRTDYSAAPISGRDLAIIVLELALTTILVWQFELEQQRHLLWGMLAVLGGFVVNVRLPPRFRPSWFLAISIAVLFAVLGWSDGLFAVSIAGSLIAATAIPISFIARVGLILGLGAAFTWMRSNSTASFWPVVGSMFMFRMISYLDAARKNQGPRTLAETAGYFLMLPNSLFPLFPVVDAKVFRDTWYNDEPRTIYQTGVHWIAAGILHLVLYRVIKYEVLPSPLAVRTLSGALLYLAANYALYLRVSGHFHLVCGMLHLFGWNLPRTHDHYFLAASFSEIWRRINIYWKDFLMKTFFYPAYFRIRGWLPFQSARRDEISIVLGVVWVFLWTWIAHSWQSFWLIGLFSIRLADGWMWLGVGLLVAGNAVVDYRRALRPRRDRGVDWPAAAIHSLQIMGMFLLVSLFWAAWTNVETFRYILYVTTSHLPTISDALMVGGYAMAVFTILTCSRVWMARPNRPSSSHASGSVFERQAAMNIAWLAIAVVTMAPGGPVEFMGPLTFRIRRLQTDRMSSAEAMAVVEGYYEQLNQANPSRPYSDDGDLAVNQVAVDFSDMIRRRDDALELELIPGWKGSWNAKPISINRWGMRDRDRTLAAEPGVRRIAVVGSSLVMGFGVGDDETFVHLLEQKLNEGKSTGDERYEVLNFGVGRYGPTHRRVQIDHKVLAFRPDLVLYFAHQDEMYTAAPRVAELAYFHANLEDEELQRFIDSLQIPPDASEATYQIEVGKHHAEIVALTYRRIRKSLDAAGIPVMYVYMPVPGDHDLPFDPSIAMKFAAEAGFPVVDLDDWWEGRPALEMVLGPRDHHPTPLGHEYVAKHLFLKWDEILAPLNSSKAARVGAQHSPALR
ncbi:hypothetical protein AYO47_03120 [Planctomyces sp. SCGC AG-212-M04]|nr:hypothetical protein AYO47_03120 [Planctomyces sp. SCGC AG-212-M04]